MSSLRSPLEEILVFGFEDWFDLRWLFSTCAETESSPERAQELALEVIREALMGGVLIAGDLERRGHRPWPIDARSAVDRISNEWLALGRMVPQPDEIVWFDLTPAGEQLAREVLAREQAAT